MDGSRMSVRCTTIAESGSRLLRSTTRPTEVSSSRSSEEVGGAVPPRSWPIRGASRQGEGDGHGHRRGSAHYRRFECRCRVRRNEDGNRPVLTVRNRSRAVSHVDPIDSEPDARPDADADGGADAHPHAHLNADVDGWGSVCAAPYATAGSSSA